MSISPKMVLEGNNWVSMAVLFTDKDDVDLFWNFLLEHVTKGHKYMILSFFSQFWASFFYKPGLFFEKSLTPIE